MATPESKVRDPVVRWARSHGIGHVRMSFRPGVKRGVPDDLFLLPGGVAVWVEFKAPGKQPTPLQMQRLMWIGGLGFAAAWCDNAEKGIAMLNELVNQLVEGGVAEKVAVN